MDNENDLFQKPGYATVICVWHAQWLWKACMRRLLTPCVTEPTSPLHNVQLRTNKVIKFDNLKTKFFIEILTSDLEPGTSKTFRKGVALFFPCFFGCAKFLGVFNAPKSVQNRPSLDELCAICDAHVTCITIRYICKKKNQGPTTYVFLWETWPGKGLSKWQFQRISHHCWEISNEYLAKILMGSDRRNKKKSIGTFFIFLTIFSGTCQILGV